MFDHCSERTPRVIAYMMAGPAESMCAKQHESAHCSVVRVLRTSPIAPSPHAPAATSQIFKTPGEAESGETRPTITSLRIPSLARTQPAMFTLNETLISVSPVHAVAVATFGEEP